MRTPTGTWSHGRGGDLGVGDFLPRAGTRAVVDARSPCGPGSGAAPSRLRILRKRGAPSGRIARGEATPDVSHLEAHFVRSRGPIQKRAPIGVGGEPAAGDRARKVEHEPVVLELGHQCLELRHGQCGVAGPLRHGGWSGWTQRTGAAAPSSPPSRRAPGSRRSHTRRALPRARRRDPSDATPRSVPARRGRSRRGEAEGRSLAGHESSRAPRRQRLPRARGRSTLPVEARGGAMPRRRLFVRPSRSKVHRRPLAPHPYGKRSRAAAFPQRSQRAVWRARRSTSRHPASVGSCRWPSGGCRIGRPKATPSSGQHHPPSRLHRSAPVGSPRAPRSAVPG